MKKNLLHLMVLVSLTVSATTIHAQVKGNPAFNGPSPDQTTPPKVPSRLSPELKKLSDTYCPNGKIAQSTQKPVFLGRGQFQHTLL